MCVVYLFFLDGGDNAKARREGKKEGAGSFCVGGKKEGGSPF